MPIPDRKHAALICREDFEFPLPQGTRKSGDSLRVLLAENNKLNQLVARILLERMGCRVDVVENRLAACRATQNGCYDAVLMGSAMPTISEFEASRRARSIERSSRTPIIAIAKPVSAKELERALDRWIARPINAH